MSLSYVEGEPWFEDGNIVILTDASNVAFKVHRGVLARHSEVFQSMFELPQPLNGNLNPVETLEGHQVVRLYDLPDELSNLVKGLYDGVTFYNRNLEDFFYLAGILRLSTKYFIGRLRTQAIQHLTQTWSYSLRGHDDMVNLALKSPITDNTTYPYVHPLHILNLSTECNVRIVLPSVFYFLSLYPLHDILRGDHPKLMVDHQSAPSSVLSMQDVGKYALMFQRRLDIILDFVRRFCGERHSLTCTKEACTRRFAHLSSRLSKSWMTRTGPLHYMLQAVHELNDDETICYPCRKAFRRDVEALREEIWDQLPSVVGLPSWHDLKVIDLPTAVS